MIPELVFGVYGKGEGDLAPGQLLDVVLRDGMGVSCLFTLRDIAQPPREIRLPRPEHIPALLAARDPGFVYFELTNTVDTHGRPLYTQIVKD